MDEHAFAEFFLLGEHVSEVELENFLVLHILLLTWLLFLLLLKSAHS